MKENRMLSDEILLGLIKKNGGGGGGTKDYNQLENQPQIGGVTLKGNKTLSDLGIASASAIGQVQEQVNELAEEVAEIKPVDYSTTEQKTGQKWIDGKAIYRKVIDTGALPNATTKNVPHGISGIDTVVKIYGIAKNTSDGGVYPLPQVLASENISLQVSLYIFDENICMKCTSNRSNFDESYVIVEYTKTESE